MNANLATGASRTGNHAEGAESGGQRSEHDWAKDPVWIINADVFAGLKQIPDESVQCVVTSPPYWGLRSYLPAAHPLKEFEIGQESVPDCQLIKDRCGKCYVCKMVSVFQEIYRVLRPDGTVWLNLGDTYAGGGNGGGGSFAMHAIHCADKNEAARTGSRGVTVKSKRIARGSGRWGGGDISAPGFKSKDLIGIPWRVALALQAAGWYLRSDIIWAKPNCMPESVTDRPTRAHEYLFLLTKSERYFYDHEAIKEPAIYDVDGTGTAARKARAHENTKSFPMSERNGLRPAGYKNSINFNGKNSGNEKQRGHSRRHNGFNDRWDQMTHEEQSLCGRNKRDVWTIPPANYPEAHFATFPAELIRPCILAGTSAHGACPECNAPWKRIVERGLMPTAKACKTAIVDERDLSADAQDQGSNRQKDGHRPGMISANKTLGWSASCGCHKEDGAARQHRPTISCTVLDPFGGSGTTAQVARELGQRAILIDLNPNYIPMQKQRIAKVTPGLRLA